MCKMRLHVSVLTLTKDVKYEYLWRQIDVLGGKPVVSQKSPRVSTIDTKSFDECNAQSLLNKIEIFFFRNYQF